MCHLTAMEIKNKINLNTLGIVIILIFSFIIRVNNLSNNPAGFFADEAQMGIDAYNILKNAADRHGNFLPLFFKGFNYDNTSLYQVYLTVPFVALFGLNETAVRLTPVFWSNVELFVFYLLLAALLSKPYALIGTIMLSLSPWHFHISRINMGDYYSWTLLTLLAYLFLVYGFKNGKTYPFLISAIFFGLATYSYTPARLTTPLLFVLTLSILLLKKYLRITLLMIFIYMIILIPFLHFHITDPHSLQRLRDTAGIDIRDIRSQNTVKPNTSSLTAQFFNKYFLHYSDLFLFQKGDADFPGQFLRRHSIPGLGLLYPYQKIIIAIGLVLLMVKIIKMKKYELLFIIYLLFLFPVADSITSDKTPFSTRSYLGVLPFHLLIAFGINGIYQLLQKSLITKINFMRILFILFSLYLVLSSGFTLFKNFNDAPKTTSDFWGWQFGARDIVKYFVSQQSKYDELIMAPEFNAPDIFFKFYAPNDCNKCRVGLPDSNYNPSAKQLFAVTPTYLREHPFIRIKTQKTIYNPNGTIAFQIGEIIK